MTKSSGESPRELRTERLTLARAHLDHVQELFGAVEASHEEVDAWMGWSADSTLETTADFIRHATEAWAGGSEYHFSILLDGVAVGSVGLNRVNPLDQSAELGYWIRSDVAGRGLMTEAAAAVVDFAFADLGLHRLELRAGLENHRSIRVAEKLGFRKEGILRHGSRAAAGFYDVHLFGLLATDRR